MAITREQLKASGNLEKMLGWGKSNLMPIAVPFGDKTIYTQTRLAFIDGIQIGYRNMMKRRLLQ